MELIVIITDTVTLKSISNFNKIIRRLEKKNKLHDVHFLLPEIWKNEEISFIDGNINYFNEDDKFPKSKYVKKDSYLIVLSLDIIEFVGDFNSLFLALEKTEKNIVSLPNIISEMRI